MPRSTSSEHVGNEEDMRNRILVLRIKSIRLSFLVDIMRRKGWDNLTFAVHIESKRGKIRKQTI